MASSKVTERTRRAVSEVLRRQGYVAAVGNPMRRVASETVKTNQLL